MIIRIARLTAAEFLKLSAHPFLYFSLAILLASTLSAEILQPMFLGQKETAWRAYHSVQLFAYGFKFGLQIATLVLLIFSSMTFAGEFDRGTIKNLLTRPITRGEFFVAKSVTVVGLAGLLFFFVLFVSLVYAFWKGNLGPVWDDRQYIMMRGGAEIAAYARKAVAMTFFSFLAAGFLGILISNLTDSSGYAVAIGLVLFLFGDVITGMLSDAAQQKVFLYYAPYALEKLRLFGEGTTTRWNPDIDRTFSWVTIPAAYSAVFIPLAFSIFRVRNIHA